MRDLAPQILLTLMMTVGSTAQTPKHILFAFVDHFEPSGSTPDRDVRMWVEDYMAMAGRHLDADGRHPIHSYFVVGTPVSGPDCLHGTLTQLNQVTYRGYGEVEYHGHHGISDERKRTEEEATQDLLNLISQAKEDFNGHGALITAEPAPRITFGFIHGMWALDNSRLLETYSWPVSSTHHEYCGVNRELELLNRQGAYADFTFPAWGTMDPLMQDALFYATDDNSPASYEDANNVHLVEVNQPPQGDLMIVQGPSVDYSKGLDACPNISAVPGSYPYLPTLWRMDHWVSHNIHVIGRDDWIFIKIHTHGCAGDLTDKNEWNCFFGPPMDRFYSDIEKKYNDGAQWKLHYVSAREMYNIIKAAEAGMTGDPDAYRNFTIPPYANQVILTENRYRLMTYDTGDAILEVLDSPATVDMCLRQFPLHACILESNEAVGPWYSSDAMKDAGSFEELHLLDTTPSRFYRIVSSKEEP